MSTARYSIIRAAHARRQRNEAGRITQGLLWTLVDPIRHSHEEIDDSRPGM